MESVASRTQQLRERVLSAVTLWFAIGGCLTSAVFSVQASRNGEAAIDVWFGAVGASLVAVLKGFQPRLRYRTTALLFLAQLLVLITYTQSFHGLLPGTVLGDVAFLVLSGLFFGARGVLGAFAVLMGTFALACWLVLRGVLKPWSEAYWDPLEPLVWLRYAIVLGFYGGGLCAAFVLLIGGLEKLASRLRETLDRERAERAQREAAQHALEKSKRLEALGELAAGVAHDFNNSLMVIMGGASVLRADPSATPAVAALADEIIERARTGAQTVQQLLSLGRSHGGDANVVTLDEVLRRTLPTLKQALSDSVQLEVAGIWQGRVHVDVARLQQALLNLATNARDAMPNGGCWTLRATEHQIAHVPAGWASQPGCFVAIECIDSGVGVHVELVERMFEPFVSTKAAGKGAGLGLAMVRKTMNDAGGFIEVESELGVGTTFRLFFPVYAERLARRAR